MKQTSNASSKAAEPQTGSQAPAAQPDYSKPSSEASGNAKWRTQDDGLHNYHSDRTGTQNLEPDKTVQSHAELTDINRIIRDFMPNQQRMLAQQLEHWQMDFSQITDYQTALNQQIEMHARFGTLPSELRARFDNNPGNFLDWISDKANHEEATKWGLLAPKAPEPKPMRVEVIPPPNTP